MARILKILSRAALVAGLAALAGGGGPPAAAQLALSLGERESHCRSGEAVTRTVILTNAGATTAAVRLNWRLAAAPALIESGAASLAAPPRQSLRLPLRLRLPAVRRPADLTLAVQAAAQWTGPPLMAQAALRVYPSRLGVPWAFLARQRIGVYDPRGRLLARLRALGGKPQELFSPAEARAFKGDLLLLGEASLRTPAAWESLRDSLAWRFSRMPVVVLAQRWALPPDGWPDQTGALAAGDGMAEESGIGVLRPVDFNHPMLQTVDPRDLIGWRAPPKPPLPAWEAPGLEAFSWPAPAQPALEEETLPGGRRVLYCQVPLLGRWEAEPACEILLSALLRDALARPPRR